MTNQKPIDLLLYYSPSNYGTYLLIPPFFDCLIAILTISHLFGACFPSNALEREMHI